MGRSNPALAGKARLKSAAARARETPAPLGIGWLGGHFVASEVQEAGMVRKVIWFLWKLARVSGVERLGAMRGDATRLAKSALFGAASLG